MIFLKSHFDKGKARMRPVSGQFFKTGKAIDHTFQVSCEQEIRDRFSIGSYFVCDDLTESSNFYRAVGKLRVYNDDAPVEERFRPEEIDALEKLLGGSSAGKKSPKPKPVAVKKKTYLDRLMSNPKFSVPTIAEHGFYVDPDVWFLSLRNIKKQDNTMYVGPTGTGKTQLVKLICKKAGIPFPEPFDMGAMVDPSPALLGTHRLVGGKSIFDYARFALDIQKPGCIMLDELSRPAPVTTNFLLPLLDDRRTLNVEIAGGKDVRSIKAHEECSFVATANIGSQYTGTVVMDRALVDRFDFIELDYLEAAVEIEILMARTNIDEDEAIKLVSVANNIRTQYKKQEISNAVSTRESLRAASLVADGWSVLKALEYSYLPLFEGTKAEGERSIVAKIITSK